VGDKGDYCAFTKTVEHLGDCWSLVILRELTLHEGYRGDAFHQRRVGGRTQGR